MLNTYLGRRHSMKANKKKEPKNWFRVTGILPPDDTAVVKRDTRESMTDKTNGYHIMSNAIMMYLRPHEFKLFSYIVKQSARYGGAKVTKRKLSDTLMIGENDVKVFLGDLENIGLVEKIYDESKYIKIYAPIKKNIEKLEGICSDLSDRGISQLRKMLEYNNIGKVSDAKLEKAISECENDLTKNDNYGSSN